jgi:dihydrofolate reductase
MRKISVFNNITLDGYFVGANGDMSWAHKYDPEWTAFASDNAKGGGELLFGRVTYDMMVSYWPTPLAMQTLPIVAENMNKSRKYVVSRTLEHSQVTWNNTTLIKGDLVDEIRKLKHTPGDGIVILGSGSIVSQLTEAGLVDEFQIALMPVALGKGRTLFQTLKQKLDLKLTQSRAFGNGNVFLRYERAA